MMKIINSLIIICCLGIMASFCTGIHSGEAKAEVNTVVKVYEVKEGDGYWHIAKQHFDEQNRFDDIRDYVDAIKMANNYKRLVPGDKVTVVIEKTVK